MKKKTPKTFSAVMMMREIRDRISLEMKGLAPGEQIAYVERKSGLRKPATKKDADHPRPGAGI